MKCITRHLAATVIITVCATAGGAAGADDGQDRKQANRYLITDLTSDLPGVAPNTDPVLQNSWGVAFSPGASPFWIADNATGCSTLYDGTGLPQPQPTPLQVKLPLPGGTIPNTACMHVNPPPAPPPNPTPAAPTGMVWNPTTNPMTAFLVPGTNLPAAFIWATEDGTISAWAGGLMPRNEAVLAADNSNVPDAANGAVYKGLVVGTNVNGVFLFATNFRAGTIDVFAPDQDSSGVGLPFKSITTDGGFVDPDIPAGFAPFGIENIDGNLFVTYALQKLPDKHDDMAGPGNGFVDVFDTDGHLLRRFASRGPLNSPWGVTRASFAFGRFSGDILVGNFGNGKIHAFNSNGNFLGTLRDPNGKPLAIDGLWKLTLGGGAKSSSDTLYFTAGPNDEMDGRFGTITPVSKKSEGD